MQRDGGVTGASGLNRRTAPTMEGQLMNMLHRSGVVVASGLMFTAALGAPAQAQVEQDGLVNVNVGDVFVLNLSLIHI